MPCRCPRQLARQTISGHAIAPLCSCRPRATEPNASSRQRGGAPLPQVLVDLIFALDILMQFFQGFVDRGFPVVSFSATSRRYLTSWFAIDLIATIPYPRIASIGGDTGAWGHQVDMISLLRLPRLVRIWHNIRPLLTETGGTVLTILGERPQRIPQRGSRSADPTAQIPQHRSHSADPTAQIPQRRSHSADPTARVPPPRTHWQGLPPPFHPSSARPSDLLAGCASHRWAARRCVLTMPRCPRWAEGA